MRPPFVFFILLCPRKTTSGGRTHTVCAGDIVNPLDIHQYRILKIIATFGPIVHKRTNNSTYRSFLRNPLQVSVSAPQMVNQSTQTDTPPPATRDPQAHDILQCCGPAAVEAYHQGHPYCMGDIHCITLPEPIESDQPQVVGHKLQEAKQFDNHKQERFKKY